MRSCRQLLLTVVLFLHAIQFQLIAAAQSAVPRSSHVVLLMDENTSYSTTLAKMPWLVSQGSANGYAANYFSNTTGSLMDYLWLASGSCHSSVNCALRAGSNDFGCTGNTCAAPITDDNIFREMNNRGISWKVYAQSYTAAGGTVTTPDLANGTHYYRRHNGATWYSDILSNVAGSQAKIVDFSRFAVDLANDALPQFSIIAPDGLNDGHDTGPAPADLFLSTNLPPLLATPYFQPGGDGLLIITFDNGDADAAGQVYTAVIGPNVTPNTVSNTAYKHENAFRTLLDALGITTTPGFAAIVPPMKDFFSGYVTITSPAPNAIAGPQVLISASATETSAQIYQLQVWDNTTGQKLAESTPGSSTIYQTVSLAPGSHQIIVEDISTGTYSVLHKAAVNITVSDGGIVIASPASNVAVDTQVLVSASAIESNGQIYQLQVWDDTTGQKLGESLPGSSIINRTFSFPSGLHRIVVEDLRAGTFGVLHKASVNIGVQPEGVTIASPAPDSTSGTQVLVSASARESGAQIYQLQVWDHTTGQKLAESSLGSSAINQTLTLAPGQHQIVVEDISAANYQVVQKSSVIINVSSTPGVNILSPANNSNIQGPVLVSAYANSSIVVDHLEVWDATTGTKLGDSFGSQVNAAYSLPLGQHTLVVQAVSTGNFQILATSQISISVN